MLQDSDYVTAMKGKVACDINVACSLLEHAVKHRVKGVHKKDLRAMMMTYAKNHDVGKDDLDIILKESGPLSQQGGAPVAPVTISAVDLMKKKIEPPTWIVPGILPAGLTVLGGNPKAGKSWLCLDLAIATGSGGALFGELDCGEPAEALYLALEDTDYRLQSRLKKILVDELPEGVTLATEWPSMDQGGIDYLAEWIDEHPATKLIIIDTLQMFRPAGAKNGQIYAEDYKALQPVKALADKHKIAIVLVHHLRKAPSKDPFEKISGSHGITGAADTNIVLERDPSTQNASLHIRGRDVGDTEFALLFDQDLGRWQLLGEYELPATAFQQAILATIKDKALKPSEIAVSLDTTANNVTVTLNKMAKKFLVTKQGYGKYISAAYHLEQNL